MMLQACHPAWHNRHAVSCTDDDMHQCILWAFMVARTATVSSMTLQNYMQPLWKVTPVHAVP
jgi:hypothetical protein